MAPLGDVLAAPEKWTKAIDAYTTADAAQPPARGGIVFIGSSSIRKWATLAQDFSGFPLLNRGFGGSALADSVSYTDRIVLPYQPCAVVVYAGDNDLEAGKSPETIAADFNPNAEVEREAGFARNFTNR